MGRRAADKHYKGPAKLAAAGGEQEAANAAKAAKEAAKASQPPLPKGKTLLSRVKEILNEKSLRTDGRYNSRFDDCAEAFVKAMEGGSFIHMKEFIDRQEGKVPNRIADADGKNLKMYVGVPLDGPDAP